MFPFSAQDDTAKISATAPAHPKTNEPHPLDTLTGGAFSAHTAGERAAHIRDWLAQSPSVEQMQLVFKELSGKDKGAAKLLREKLDAIKRSKTQESVMQVWADKAQALLALGKLNIADAMAWQRDAAKAGAPLSKEPLASFKTRLGERITVIEDLQHRSQVQREAAVLLAQRIEVLSTKPWRDAQAVVEALQLDVERWQQQAGQLCNDADWISVDTKFPPLLEASRNQLLVVWESFKAALAQANAAAGDAALALPAVLLWADELRLERGVPVAIEAQTKKPALDPALKAQATVAVNEALTKLELEIAQGHGKASAGAAASMRNALKEFGRLVDDKLENRCHAALAAAGELEGWQRWRADQLREELVAKAERLSAPLDGKVLGGHKMQESLRALREQWKQTDQGGAPNHALWKRFDDACNQAHKVVEAWLDKVKAETAAHRAQRLELMAELNAWAAANQVALDDDWKGFARVLHEFGERWRAGGYVGEKIFAELQPLWKTALKAATAPLEELQKSSLAARQAMIDEAQVLAGEPALRLDAVKALQQRWQAEAQRVPLERHREQKLWDAFRKPIDDAFQRRSAQRESANAALSERDRVVFDAAKALEVANSTGDAQLIRSAMLALEQALKGQVQAQQALQSLSDTTPTDVPAPLSERPVQSAGVSDEPVLAGDAPVPAASAVAPVAVPKPAPRAVVAMRGDDRPGMKKSEPAPAGRAGKFAQRGGAERDNRRDSFDPARARTERSSASTFAPRSELPRLGDAAFRAQRDALEHAQLALKKLATQAHGEALTQLLEAWQQRDATQIPKLSELGRHVSAASRVLWCKALAQQPTAEAGVALLRLEMAAECPTPAEHLSARRLLQLQLLTRRHDPAPIETWVEDVATVLTSSFDAGAARRLQSALKLLLKP